MPGGSIELNDRTEFLIIGARKHREKVGAFSLHSPLEGTRGGPCQHGFMCGCRQWSNYINESN